MWKEGEARCRSGLQCVALEMLVEVEDRRKIRLRERHAYRVWSGRCLEADGCHHSTRFGVGDGGATGAMEAMKPCRMLAAKAIAE